MAVSIRLRREGTKNRPYYKVVVTDSRSPRDGKFIEIIGTYDPKLKGDNSKLNLERALQVTVNGGSGHPIPDLAGVMSARDLARLERENLRRALEATDWQIAGEGGAAKLLGLAPSTLASRVKALRLRRHR